VGRLKKVKRPELVLEVARLLPEFNFLIVGVGHLRNKLVKNAPKNVKFSSPSKEELVVLFKKQDLFLNTSECEGTPRALLEAASFGKPIVTTEIGEFVSGQIQEPSSAGLAYAIRFAYSDRKRLGREAWKFVRKNHSVEKNKKGWEFFNAFD